MIVRVQKFFLYFLVLPVSHSTSATDIQTVGQTD